MIKKIVDIIASEATSKEMRHLIWAVVIFTFSCVFLKIGYAAENKYVAVGFYIGFMLTLFVAAWRIYRPLNLLIHHAITPKINEKRSDTERTSSFIAAASLVILSLMIVLLCVDFIVHQKAIANAATDSGAVDCTQVTANCVPKAAEGSQVFLGTFGDFFGGVVNPLLSFITLIALAITFGLQRLQLKEARDQARASNELVGDQIRDAREQAQKSELLTTQQTFENTFFNMLALHHSTAEQLQFDSDVLIGSARFPAHYLYSNSAQLGKCTGRAVFAGVLATMESMQFAIDAPQVGAAAGVYAQIQNEHNYVLGHYFRHLYQILALIERSFPEQDIANPEWRKSLPKQYANVLRAQLSANELTLLMFNCSRELVDKGEFRKLLVRYELLEHIPLTIGPGDGMMSIREYGFEVDIGEYLGTPGAETYGAFGKNPEVGKYFAAGHHN